MWSGIIYLKEAVYKALSVSKDGWPERHHHHQGRSWGDGQRDGVLDEIWAIKKVKAKEMLHSKKTWWFKIKT